MYSFAIISCTAQEEEDFTCPGFEVAIESPYTNPVWHPSGDIIGFNWRPLKGIDYKYGFDCPEQAEYLFSEDSVGFYIVNRDGTNIRMVLPNTLQSPSWSPDGKWIAYVEESQIFKMPFDGDRFDTTSVIQLTFGGRNFFPSWSPDGKWIAFDSNLDSPTGLNYIWTMRSDGSQKRRIAFTPNEGETRMANWATNYAIVHQRYSSATAPEIFQMDSVGNGLIQLTNNNNFERHPKMSPDLKLVAYISQSPVKKGIKLWAVKVSSKAEIQLIDTDVIDFSWSPQNEIVYVNFDTKRLDEVQGTLWVSNSNGQNERQLTFNQFVLIK